MRYLLDTHTALWGFIDRDKLPAHVSEVLDNTSHPLFISIASVWEVAIKIGLKKLEFEGGSKEFLNKIQTAGIEILGITGKYLERYETLSFLHRDPFDRLLIASAQAEDMVLLTADENIQKYDVKWIWQE